jgi:hypothetical protein
MSIGGFNCSHPDIGAGKVEDELNGAVAIPSVPGTADSRFNLSLLEGGDVLRPRPAIRAAFSSTPDGPGIARLDGSQSHAAAGTLRYVWDFDGDGSLDQATDDPVIRHDFGGPGKHEVALLVVDKDGDISRWKTSEVTTTSKPKESSPLRVTVTGPKQAVAGKKVRLKVRVTNRGRRKVSNVRVCARSLCRKLGNIRAGKSRKLTLKPVIRRSAKRVVSVTVRATGRGVKPGIARVRFSVK